MQHQHAPAIQKILKSRMTGWIRIILGGKELGKPGLKTSSRCSGLCAQSPPSHKNHFKTQGSRTTNPLGIFLFAATEL